MIETFSKLPLLDSCAGAGALPWTPSSSAAATEGSFLHRFLQAVRVADGGEDLDAWREALETVPAEFREAAQEWDLTGLPTDPAAFTGEVALALDVERSTARELGREKKDRDYGELAAGEIPGAADAVWLLGEDAIGVGDLKTGWKWVPPPRDNLQLRGLHAAAGLAYGRDEGEVVIWHRRKDSSGWTERARLDVLDQADTLDAIRGIRARVAAARAEVAAGRRPELREGPWCNHCPAFASCPAKVELVNHLALSAAPDELGPFTERFRSQLLARPREVYLRFRAIKDLVKRIEGILDVYAEHNPIDLGDGREFGLVETKRESFDGAIAFRVIKARYGEPAAWTALKMRAPKEAIEDAIRGAAFEPGKRASGIGKLKAEVFDAIRAEKDGAHITMSRSCKERPKKERAE